MTETAKAFKEILVNGDEIAYYKGLEQSCEGKDWPMQWKFNKSTPHTISSIDPRGKRGKQRLEDCFNEDSMSKEKVNSILWTANWFTFDTDQKNIVHVAERQAIDCWKELRTKIEAGRRTYGELV